MNAFFVSVRVLHILLGAVWLGAAVLVSLFVMPSIREAGPDGAKVMAGLGRRKIHVFIASISGLTALTGVWLYWHFTDGFTPALMKTAAFSFRSASIVISEPMRQLRTIRTPLRRMSSTSYARMSLGRR